MSIARICRMYRCCFPHEMLGYERDDLEGILLTFKLSEKINKEESGGSDGKRNSRFAKYHKGQQQLMR